MAEVVKTKLEHIARLLAEVQLPVGALKGGRDTRADPDAAGGYPYRRRAATCIANMKMTIAPREMSLPASLMLMTVSRPLSTVGTSTPGTAPATTVAAIELKS